MAFFAGVLTGGKILSTIITAMIGTAATMGTTYLLTELSDWLQKKIGQKEAEKLFADAGVKQPTETTTPTETTENPDNTKYAYTDTQGHELTGSNIQDFPEEWLTTTAPPTTNTGGIQIQRPGGTIPGNSAADGATDLPNVGEIVTPTDKENSMVDSTTPQTKPTITPPTIGGTDGGNIMDTTGKNEEVAIKPAMTIEQWLELIEKQQKERWAREDAIRKETQVREDTAYQRSVADMLKAGINPNLMNVQPAESGGGITQATGQDMSGLLNQIDVNSEELQQLIDNAFKEDENSKDRFTEIFGNLVTSIVMALILKKG